jgi:glycosyltransferase involved in cell wall biosynthesis
MDNGMYFLNGRFLRQRCTGVQRVAVEISSRLQTQVQRVIPRHMHSGLAGHMWEQCVLPAHVHDGVLWSPCNTGPLAVRRQIVTIHDMAVFDHPEWFSASFARLYHLLLPRLARRVAKIVTVSEFSRRRIADRLAVDASKIDVIYPGVGENFRPQRQQDIDAVKRKYGLDGCRYFVTLGTIEPRKNLDLVMRAWKEVGGELGAGVRLVVIGDGNNAVFSQTHAVESLRNVLFTGYVKDAELVALLCGAVALLYPSLYEGFGLPPLEAMACGIPAVITRCASLAEVGGNAAFYVDSDDPRQMGGVLSRLVRETALCEDYGQRGRERAAGFTWQRSAAAMDNLLQAY